MGFGDGPCSGAVDVEILSGRTVGVQTMIGRRPHAIISTLATVLDRLSLPSQQIFLLGDQIIKLFQGKWLIQQAYLWVQNLDFTVYQLSFHFKCLFSRIEANKSISLRVNAGCPYVLVCLGQSWFMLVTPKYWLILSNVSWCPYVVIPGNHLPDSQIISKFLRTYMLQCRRRGQGSDD